MKKLFTIILALMLTLSIFVACDENDEQTTPNTEANTTTDDTAASGIDETTAPDAGNTTTAPEVEETIAAATEHQHTEEVIPAVAATCTKTGLTEGKKCFECSEVLVKQEETPIIAHTEVKIDAVAATCTKTGLTEGKKCFECSEVLVKQEETPIIAHTEVKVDAVAATCTKTGLTEGKKCSVCGTVTVVQTEAAKLAHTYDDKYDATCNACGFVRDAECAHTETEKLAGKAATCIETGLTEGTKCKKCGEILTKQETIQKTAHTEVVDKAVAATCSKTGLTAGKHCSVCNTITIKQNSVPSLGHKWNAATCLTAKTCSACGSTEGKALGHTEVIDKAIAATCTKTGLTEGRHCSVCNTVTKKQTTVSAKGHSWDSGTVTTEPNCTEKGVKTYKCANCTETKREDVKAKGHKYSSEWTIDKAATCTVAGSKSYHCTICGDKKDVTEIPANGTHTYEYIYTDDKHVFCIFCGETVECTEGLEYELINNGTCYAVCGIGTATDVYIYIPHRYMGLRVTEIADYAFEDCSNLASVMIPSGVKSIGNYAFSGCSNLASVMIPPYGGVQSIGNDAFSGCSSLTSITILDNVRSIGDNAFSGCSSLTSITIPDSVRWIGYDAFLGCNSLNYNEYDNAYYLGDQNNPYVVLIEAKSTDISSCTIHIKTKFILPDAFYICSNLTSITIPDSVMKIGDYAFFYCSSLTSITIPDSVWFIGNDAFTGCSSLTSITVDPENTEYHSVGNCLIDTKTKVLILGCNNSVIPTDGSVTSIADYAFINCNKLTSVTIPDSVTSIGEGVFYNCAELTSITIGNGVMSIGAKAFFNCDSLITITIPDSVTSIGEMAFGYCGGNLKNVTIGNGVETIGDSVFECCLKLNSITIPNSVMSIGDYSFKECIELTDISFKGTKAEWNAITKGDNWDWFTGEYTIHCTDGDISK